MARMKIADIHVNQHVDAKNRREGRADPCITVKVGRTNRYAAEVEVQDYAGVVVARVCYRPEAPLPQNGARCWIEATGVTPLRLFRGGQVVAELPAAPAVVHVSKRAIRGNGDAQGEPILTVWQGDRAPLEAEEVQLLGQGAVLATIVYRPAEPLPCGAKCWVRTWSPNVRLIGEVASPGRRAATIPPETPKSPLHRLCEAKMDLYALLKSYLTGRGPDDRVERANRLFTEMQEMAAQYEAGSEDRATAENHVAAARKFHWNLTRQR